VTLVDDRPTFATWHRLSPRMLLVHPVQELIRSFPVLLGAIFAGASNGHASYTGLIVAGLVTLYSLTRWFTTRLQITPEQVQLRHGLLRRRTTATARDRIRTVDVTSHVLHRVLGLARVTVGTGSNDRKGEGRLVLDGLSTAQADRLRGELLHRTPAPADEPVPARADGVELARLDPRWIRLAPLTLSGVAAGLVLWGLFWRIRGESGVDITRWGPIHAVTEWLRGLPLGLEIAVVVAAVLVFIAVTSTAGYVLVFWNFRLVRHDGGMLQVTRGLLTTRATSIERRRLVGVEFSEPLLLRLAGATRTLAVATGLRTGRGAERGGEVLLPPAPVPLATALATRVLDGTAAVTVPLVAHGAAARRRRILRAVLAGAVVLALTLLAWAAGAPGWVSVVGAVPLALAPLLGADRYRGLGHARVDGYLVSRFGGLVRRRTTLAEHAIIGVTVRSTFFQRRAGLATLTVTTAAGKQGYSVIDVDESTALELADAALDGLVATFAALS
jgi:putative membrane protein